MLQHESALIKQSGFFFPPLCYFLKYISFFSWNKALLPSDAESESASALKDVPVLEKQREVMLRKAKEYHRGVERMTVRFGGIIIPSPSFFLSFFSNSDSLTAVLTERTTDRSANNARPAHLAKREKPLTREGHRGEKGEVEGFSRLTPRTSSESTYHHHPHHIKLYRLTPNDNFSFFLESGTRPTRAAVGTAEADGAGEAEGTVVAQDGGRG